MYNKAIVSKAVETIVLRFETPCQIAIGRLYLRMPLQPFGTYQVGLRNIIVLVIFHYVHKFKLIYYRNSIVTEVYHSYIHYQL